jgi:hypothetical protein
MTLLGATMFFLQGLPLFLCSPLMCFHLESCIFDELKLHAKLNFVLHTTPKRSTCNALRPKILSVIPLDTIRLSSCVSNISVLI